MFKKYLTVLGICGGIHGSTMTQNISHSDTSTVDTTGTTVSYELGAMLNQGSGNKATYHYNDGLTVPMLSYGATLSHQTKQSGDIGLTISGLEGTFRENAYPDNGLILSDIDNHIYNLFVQRESKTKKHSIVAGQEGSGYVGGSQSTTPRSNNTSRFLDISNTTPFRLTSIRYTLTEDRFVATVGFINGNQTGIFDIDGEVGLAFKFLMNIGKDNTFTTALSGLHTASDSYMAPLVTYKPSEDCTITLQGLYHENRNLGTQTKALALDLGYALAPRIAIGCIGEYVRKDAVNGGQIALSGKYTMPNRLVSLFVQGGVQTDYSRWQKHINVGLFVTFSGNAVVQ